jgi:hypothetical protein
VLNAQTAERDEAMIELTACLEVLREDKDRAVAALAEAQAKVDSRTLGKMAVDGLEKLELLDLVADQAEQLNAATAELVRVRDQLVAAGKEPSEHARVTDELSRKLGDLQGLLRVHEEKRGAAAETPGPAHINGRAMLRSPVVHGRAGLARGAPASMAKRGRWSQLSTIYDNFRAVHASGPSLRASPGRPIRLANKGYPTTPVRASMAAARYTGSGASPRIASADTTLTQGETPVATATASNSTTPQKAPLAHDNVSLAPAAGTMDEAAALAYIARAGGRHVRAGKKPKKRNFFQRLRDHLWRKFGLRPVAPSDEAQLERAKMAAVAMAAAAAVATATANSEAIVSPRSAPVTARDWV